MYLTTEEMAQLGMKEQGTLRWDRISCSAKPSAWLQYEAGRLPTLTAPSPYYYYQAEVRLIKLIDIQPITSFFIPPLCLWKCAAFLLIEPNLLNLITAIIAILMREEEQLQDSLPGKPRKEQRVKGIKKKGQPIREITHYFSKVQKQPATVNRNIPTPDKAAIEQIDQAFAALLQQELELTQQIQEAKIRNERQKEEREYFLSKSRNLAATELKKIAEINRFFKRQDQLKLKDKQHLLNKTAQEVRMKKEALKNGCSNAFQEYFLKRDLEKVTKQYQRLAMDVALLTQSNRIAIEQESCYFAKTGWPLLMKRYQPLQLVGKGGFSEVYRSYDLYSNETVAIKLSSVEHLLQGCGNKHEYLKHIKREYEIHKELNHPNIVKLIEVIEIESAFCIVLQYCEGCTLAQHLKTEGALPEGEAKMIAQRIAEVIHYLSAQVPAIIHYDLKPQNIIFSRGQLKVLDFGICKTMDSEHSKMALTSQGMGTCCYLPPETLIPNNPVISNKVDVWSLGIIFYEMLRGSRPFGQGFSTASLLTGQVINRSEFFGDLTLSEQCKDFILACLQVNEARRLNPLSIMSHPYFHKETASVGQPTNIL